MDLEHWSLSPHVGETNIDGKFRFQSGGDGLRFSPTPSYSALSPDLPSFHFATPFFLQIELTNLSGFSALRERSRPVWPDWAIYWTLSIILKPFATINLPKSATFLGNFCKGVKIYHFSIEIILGNFYRHLSIFSGHTDPVVSLEQWEDESV